MLSDINPPWNHENTLAILVLKFPFGITGGSLIAMLVTRMTESFFENISDQGDVNGRAILPTTFSSQ